MVEIKQEFERPQISSEVYEMYQQCCIDLLDTARQMEKTCYSPRSEFHHRFFTNIQKEATTDADWAKVISDNNGRKFGADWDEWEISPNKLYCSQYRGTCNKSVLKDFRALATKGQSILAKYISLTSAEPPRVPEFLHWRLPSVLRSKINDLPGYHYFVYLVSKSGPRPVISPDQTTVDIAEENCIVIDRERFRIRSDYAFGHKASNVMLEWLPPTWNLDILEQAADATPRWDKNMRKLWFGKSLIKWYRQKPGLQEIVLDAFQKKDWQKSIDNPLLDVPNPKDIDERRRLRDTIAALNGCHKKPAIIRFQTNGLRTAVIWELVPDKKKKPSANR